jgi:hypothetical protein
MSEIKSEGVLMVGRFSKIEQATMGAKSATPGKVIENQYKIWVVCEVDDGTGELFTVERSVSCQPVGREGVAFPAYRQAQKLALGDKIAILLKVSGSATSGFANVDALSIEVLDKPALASVAGVGSRKEA